MAYLSNGSNGAKMENNDKTIPPSLPWWTWVAPFFIASIGTWLSLWFKTDPGTSLWYLPTALGVIMVYWWGPRALLGIYLNALLWAPLWDLPWRWSFLYALPETIEVGLSWFLFVKVLRRSVWLPDLVNTAQFIMFGSVVPAALANVYLVIQLFLLGDIARSTLWDNWIILFSADVATHFVLAVPVLILLTKFAVEKGWAKTEGKVIRSPLLPDNRNSRGDILFIASIFILVFFLVVLTSINNTWIVYGVLMVILAIRYGVNITVIASSWTGALAFLLPPILKNQLGLPTVTYSDVLVFNLQILFLCAISLLIGRAISDLFNEINERKQAEMSLRESEERWQFALEGAGDGVWDWNAQTNHVLYSRKWKEIIGFDEQDIGDTLDEWDKRVHPDDYEYVYAELNKHFTGQSPVYMSEHRVQCKDGTYKWILDRGKVISRTEDGKPLRIIGTHTDITERKQAEEQLRVQKALLESASEVSLDGIAIVSNERKWLHHNQRFVEMWKLPPEMVSEGDSHGVVDLTSRQVRDSENYLATINYLYENMDASLHDEVIFNDGRVYDRYTGPVRDADGTLYGRIWYCRDITERKKAEEALQEGEQRFSVLSAATFEGIVISDSGKIIDVNEQLTAMYGYEQSEMVHFNIDKFVAPESRELVLEHIRSGSEEPYEHFSLRKDGSTFPVEIRARSLPYKGRTFRVTAIRDITQRKAAEDKLRESEERYRLLSENSMDAILLTAPDGRVFSANPAACTMFGYSEGELIQGGRSLVTDASDPHLSAAVEERERTGKFKGELTFVRKGGEKFPGEISSTSFSNQQGQIRTSMIIRDITERKQSEKELRDSEELHRTTLSNISDAVFITDDDGNFTYICLNVHIVFGYSQAEVVALGNIGKLLGTDLFSPEELDIKTEIQNIERSITSKNGVQHVLLVNVKRVSIRGGTTLYTCHDITERRQAEKALKESEERFRLLSDVSMEGIQIHDNGVILDANLALAKQLGYHSPDELIGKQIMQQHLTPESFKKTRELAAAGVDGIYEVEGIRTDGTHFPVEVTAYTLNLKGRNVRIASTRDITERKQAEAKYQDLVERLPLVIYTSELGTNGKWTYVSPQIEKLLGYTSNEWMADPSLWYEHVHSEDRDKQRAVEEEASTKGESFNSEYRIFKRDGKEIWVRDSGHVSKPQGGGKPVVEGIIIDITERKQAEEEIQKLNAELEQRVLDRTAQLQAANRELEAFSYSVSHDLRAPLRGIDGFSTALARKYTNELGEEGKHYLTRIQENTNRMGQLIDDLLSLSRITRREMRKNRVELSAVAHEVVDALMAQESERRVDFEIEEQVEAWGDAGLLKIVLENLLSNALKFTSTREVARIEFGVFPSPSGAPSNNDDIIFFVRDNGVGFDMTYTNKLFGVFQRLHAMDEFPGTGIGLATVQRIIQRHGGRIWVEAEVDRGAAFYFTLGGENEK